MNRLIKGAAAGFGATIPMTVVMTLLYPTLPKEEQYPLPPRRITMRVAEEAGIKKHLPEPSRKFLSLANHFAFGTSIGILFSAMQKSGSSHQIRNGVLYGLGVWVLSYQGWLPALRILAPASQQPVGRNALMITAHIAWGVSMGVLLKTFGGKKRAKLQSA